jgi:hypothetical protein
VRRKAKGHTIEEAPPPERPDNVINLMDALRQSLGKKHAGSTSEGRSARTKLPARLLENVMCPLDKFLDYSAAGSSTAHRLSRLRSSNFTGGSTSSVATNFSISRARARLIFDFGFGPFLDARAIVARSSVCAGQEPDLPGSGCRSK